MKIIVGVLLLATALAYPLAENEEKPLHHVLAEQKPVVETKSALIPDQPALLPEQQPQKQEIPVHDSAEDSAESEESKEKIANKKIGHLSSSSEESKEKLEKKLEEPSKEPIKTPIKEETKPNEPLPTLKITEPIVPARLPEEPKLLEPVVPQIAAKAIAEPEEKPLALPTLKAEEKPKEDDPKLVATEIKEDTALPSEQKVEATPAAEEKLPELRKADAEEKIKTPAVALVSNVPVVEAEVKTESAKKAKSEEIQLNKKLEEKREDKPLEIAPLNAKPIEEKLAEIKPIETKPIIEKPKKPEDNLPTIPLEEPKPVEQKPIEAKATEPKPAEIKLEETKPIEEKLPEPSASSS